ncbi:ribosome biogenesis factor YjgA [Testudinibacter sp. TR-2022]|uniref:ribosome biogenesis factor YjgA n=1 Tax=Testudinibacter sp. TR-2022 TaxID=2585029 RepID=UPI00111B6A41|nr:ribosome biogenesis factor YjgA [Testudinibacter sp. TR-2022]TNH05676.1 ribosome-associated protein [Pasteurellaceae bacterium Phil11]TNH22309.1 ribosome-associated protein [Testudinibacter sp. TR-2022]TNH25057.1 ribosome-associated protein [Testudinibacter sp. TR-2022]
MDFLDEHLSELDEEQEEIIWVSKSEIKRDAEALKKFGAKLVALTAANLERIPLDEKLADAIALAQRSQRGALRRQLQYIGKLLRNTDIEPLQEALDKLENKHNQQQAMFHRLEQLRDQLLETDNNNVLSQLIAQYPALDIQHLRNLIRAAQKERATQKPPKFYREIFQYLKSLETAD